MATFLNTQMKQSFFDPANPPAKDAVKAYLDSRECPLSRIVVGKQNMPKLDVLRTFAFNGLLRDDRSCRGMNLGFYCGPGQGKTFMVKCWAETIGIPFVMVQSKALEDTWQLFEKIAATFKKLADDTHQDDLALLPMTNEYHYCVPPCIVFFDEAQALSKDLRTGGLLNAMELKDGWLQTYPPGKGKKQEYIIDCQNVCWVAASTDKGLLFEQSEAFHDRFAQHVEWLPANAEEIALIVQLNFPWLPFDACQMVASSVIVPRKAIAFAGIMEMKQNMLDCSWEEAAHQAATMNSIDEFGMEAKQVSVLRALGQCPVAKTKLPFLAGCRSAELESMIIPRLLMENLLHATHKGYAITMAGLKELDKRQIPHQGKRITVEAIEER